MNDTGRGKFGAYTFDELMSADFDDDDIPRVPSPIVMDETPVPMLGDTLTEPIIWQCRQWAVTGFGVECRDGKYPIEKSRLWEDNHGHGWPEQMAEKGWVDMHDFMTALLVARGHYGKPA